MEGSFLYSPFYPQSNGEDAIPSFRILSFTNSSQINERGVGVEAIILNWSYANGSPVTQSITPHIGNIPNAQRAFTLPGQHITETVSFMLTASDGSVSRTATTEMRFLDPIFHGVLSNASPTEAEVLNLIKRIALFNSFRTTQNIAGGHSCFASPMSNPIVDIRETVFGLSVLGTYDVINNFMLTMVDGLVVPYRVLVKSVPEHTLGMDMSLDIIF